MWQLNRIMTAGFDAVFAPMQSWPGWLSLTVFGGVTGLLAMVAFKYTSNQAAIGKVRDDIKSALLAMKLFKDNLSVTFRSQGRLFISAIKLFLYSLVPFAVMIVPMMLLIFQMGMRYEWRPLEPGETVTMTIELNNSVKATELGDVSLEAPDGVVVEVGPLPAYFETTEDHEAENSLSWRLRAEKPGDHKLVIHAGGETVEKSFPVEGNKYASVCPGRAGQEYWGLAPLFYAREKPAAKSDVIQRIYFNYKTWPDEQSWPNAKSPVFGWNIHWIITYFVMSMVIALIFKPILKVKI